MDKEVNFNVFPYEASTNLRISSVLYSACRDSIEDEACDKVKSMVQS